MCQSKAQRCIQLLISVIHQAAEVFIPKIIYRVKERIKVMGQEKWKRGI